MWVLLELERSDDDVDWQDIAEQCGFDVPITGIDDVSNPQVMQYHDHTCLGMQLDTSLPIADVHAKLLALKQRLISHPSVSAERVFALLAERP